MSYVSTQAKENITGKQLVAKRNANQKAARIDRTETSFGGKGYLTKEQYDDGMALARKMRKKSAW